MLLLTHVWAIDMSEIVKNLQIFEDNMVTVVLLTVVIGVYLVSLMLIHELSLFLPPYFEWKIKRRKSMQQFYPGFLKLMLEMKLYQAEIEEHPISENLRIASDKYIAYKSDPEGYLGVFDYEKDQIDPLIQSVDKLYQKLLEMEGFLSESGVPRFWLRHFILKRRIMKRIAWLRRYASYMKVLCENDTLVTPEVLIFEMNSFHITTKLKLDDKAMDRYFHLLERWFVKY